MLSLALALFAGEARASHFRYVQTRWSRTTTATRTVTVTYTQGERLSYFGTGVIHIGDLVPVSLSFGDGTTQTFYASVTQLNPSEDWFLASVNAAHTYSGDGPFTVSWGDCCTLSTLRNSPDSSILSYAVVDLRSGDLGSPEITVPPVVTVNVGGVRTWSLPALDADGDALTYALASSSNTYLSQPPGLSIDSATGTVSWDTTGLAQGLWITSVAVRDSRGGVSNATYIINLTQPRSPVAWWKLEPAGAGGKAVNACDASPRTSRQVLDSSGNQRSGTASASLTYAPGRINDAAVFSAPTDQIEIAYDAAFDSPSAMTVTAWVRPDRCPAGGCAPQEIVNRWYGGDSWNLQWHDNLWKFTIALSGGASYTVAADDTPPTGFDPQRGWVHVGATYDGYTMRLYVNGRQAGALTVPGQLAIPKRQTIVIGNRPSWNAFHGAIDDVRLYDVALGPTELQQLGDEVWPNTQSAANSDDWLVRNHAQLRHLNPNVLVLNFIEGSRNIGGTPVPVTDTEIQDLIKDSMRSMQNGSRYHAYSDPSAEAEVHYNYQLVNLRSRDGRGCSAPDPKAWACNWRGTGDTPYNSECYPRRPGADRAAQGEFDYGALFGAAAASWYGFPDGSGGLMPLCQLVETGRVHEVWILGTPQVACEVKGKESVEVKPRYETDPASGLPRRKDPVDPDWVAGNGSFFDKDIEAIKLACPGFPRSVRIGYLSLADGANQFVHSMSHSFEGMARRGGPIPYLSQYFEPFSVRNIDLPLTPNTTQLGVTEFLGFSYGCVYPKPSTVPACSSSSSDKYQCLTYQPFSVDATCPHEELRQGAALASTCSPCAALVCADLPDCCTTGWTRACVERARKACDRKALSGMSWCTTYDSKTISGTSRSWMPACGDVHLPTNARNQGDWTNAEQIWSTCENYALRNMPNGSDLPTVVSPRGRWDGTNDQTCTWYDYWRQNMPAATSKAKEAPPSTRKMLSWWPFLFY